jgi:hypothetical protein
MVALREEATMPTPETVRTGQSSAHDARDAVREFHAQVRQDDAALVVFFCSVAYDLDELADEMKQLFGHVEVVGCTSAGEIGPAGYRDHSISGASFPAGSFTVASGRIDDLREFELARASAVTEQLLLEAHADTGAGSFGLLLIDGLSMREEVVTRAVQAALGELPLVGGSAGDGCAFEQTLVYSDGSFHRDSAVVTVVTTALPFTTFKTQHFEPMEQRVVVTSADPDRRLITEIDGRPAAEDYARLVGVPVDELDPLRFAAQPIVVMIDGTSYVRSIQRANPDGSLTLFGAIEEGIVLRAARGGDLVQNLDEQFANLRAALGTPQVVLGFDCILRKVEMTARGLTGEVERVFGAHNTVGFSSYGEQFHGVHVNQTLTGIAIGEAHHD